MHSIRTAVFHRPARGWVAVPRPTRKETIYLCKGVSAWLAARASNSQSHNVPFAKGFLRGRLCHTQFAKTHSFSAKVCVRVTLFHRDIVRVLNIAISGTGSRGNAPCGVWGKAPHGSPRFTGKLYERYRLLLPEKGCRVNDPAGVWGKAPHGSPRFTGKPHERYRLLFPEKGSRGNAPGGG